ncbi:unnamed protein product [Cylicocyclus nassatus]|uniref:Uncharacterized protein n=1 Tax=Cylicocyclus nassatus TaxID=53992 RepID=A0AA36GM14_CYLNA|nr:unnamed protein product [Cylicocyclus nassatus]
MSLLLVLCSPTVTLTYVTLHTDRVWWRVYSDFFRTNGSSRITSSRRRSCSQLRIQVMTGYDVPGCFFP